jgi:hypothetical protein
MKVFLKNKALVAIFSGIMISVSPVSAMGMFPFLDPNIWTLGCGAGSMCTNSGYICR